VPHAGDDVLVAVTALRSAPLSSRECAARTTRCRGTGPRPRKFRKQGSTGCAARPSYARPGGQTAVWQRRRASITERGSGFAGAEGAARPAGRAKGNRLPARGQARPNIKGGLDDRAIASVAEQSPTAGGSGDHSVAEALAPSDGAEVA
jgi:hypothetical protein